MLSLVLGIISSGILLSFLCLVCFPIGLPWSLPTIPIYVSFLPILTDMDQLEIFERYIRHPMEKYGAVKIFFANRWNILTSKPEFLNIMFRDEDTFAKSGNQKKIPYSLLAKYTGDNVISAHGKVWMKYRSCIQNQLNVFDSKPLIDNAQLFVKLLKKSIEDNTEGTVLLPPLIQRLTLANIAKIALGFDIGTLKFDEHDNICRSRLHEKLNQVKQQIFKPVFLSFPFLDLLPIKSRQRAKIDIIQFRDMLLDTVYKNLIHNYKFEQTNNAAAGLIREWKLQGITDEQLKDNLVIILVAGHENPQLLLSTLFYLLAKHQNWQYAIREELLSVDRNEDILNSFKLTAFIYEALRMFPPLGQIINRRTTRKCQLGPGIIIDKDVYCGYNVYGTGTATSVWGETAKQFIPERWGENSNELANNWKKHKYDASMSAFHGGRRSCLGEKLALMEMKYVLYYVLMNFHIELHPQWKEKMTPAGPICPKMLKVKLTILKDPQDQRSDSLYSSAGETLSENI
ncbi:putative cytochrome P450 [Kluyveromyces lactis]|uniref:KLLA0C06743p n=1 Tax=Kluyveromyces lactis (strain ATCC 8585 / CBS 2359 / DSM 70799 / NBRC 1267 / NRRL Y-1140 / WM37) TaxID=284590 RepID=Q6CU91_KLULA|nr:uncharacterized protein KLLA0_C06743g [Kluyveromyces lactis]CAH01349.1 KLLA0C06743p [Kluyveromyces lactis]|eukprot:XP_452498.1 uncharacterized protein KLLA0_C06743g [Kluyveromyces lactis]